MNYEYFISYASHRLLGYTISLAFLSILWISYTSAKVVNHPCNSNQNQSTRCVNVHNPEATDQPYLRFSLPAAANKDDLNSSTDSSDDGSNKNNQKLPLPPVDRIIRGVLPALIRIRENASNSSTSPSVLFHVWSELLRLDLSLPIEIGDGDGDGELRNKASVFLDASFLYDNDAIAMRNGFLVYSSCKQCNHTKQQQHQQQQNQSLYHIQRLLLRLFVNEHNRVAGILQQKYDVRDAGALFESARKIVVAQVQRITYAEYLPALLGQTLAQTMETTYDPNVENGIYLSVNEIFFNAIKYSVSHLNVIAPDEDTKQSEQLSIQNTNNGNLFNLDQEQTENVLKSNRAHGLPTYGTWREFCAQKFSQSRVNISSHLDDNQIAAIESIYSRWSDADLLIGALAEKPVPEGYLGATLACILQMQFQNIIQGDKYWYSRRNTEQSFTAAQLDEIEKITLNSFLCSNADDLKNVVKNAFGIYNPETNPSIDCTLLPSFQLSAWKKNTRNYEYQRKDSNSNTSGSKIREYLIKKAIRKAEDDLNRRKQTEFLLWSHHGGVDPKSPIGIAAAFSKPNRNALLLANNSILLEYASNELLNLLQKKDSIRRRKRQLFDGDDSILGISDDLNGDFLQDLDISGLLPPDTAFKNLENGCPTEIGPCDPNYPYRSYTGYCNNLRKPNYGKSLTTFTRLLPAAYENGVSKPRTRSVMGIALPSARLVSSLMHLDISHLHSKYSLMLMQFAQFVDHDITFTPVHRGFFASIPDCRPCDSPLTVHPECMPIEIPAGDPYYPQVNFTSGQRFCLPFMRSLPGQQTLGSREQINQNSAFLDASQVYGEHACQARQLRSFQGRLNTTVSLFGDKELLPQSPSHPECKAPSGYCFIAGDGRASEQPGLTAIHTIFMREHNRLADGLRFVNPHWDNERLYQQARRIVIAEYQHVVYNEFLPRLLGHNAMHLYGLSLEPHPQYFKGYSDECNPSALSEFVSAAFRIGHSLLRPHIPRMSSLYQPVEPSILLRDTFFNPDVIYQRQIVDEIVRGLISTPVETLDQFITKEITNHLFEDKKIPHSGMDLPALNVQRARDHGVPSYNEYRAMCNLKRATTWEDFSKELPSDVITRLKRIYPTVDDVDLFPAGISERPQPGGLVGPTFGCIIGIQFRQLRNCDRFWYETPNPILRFTQEQIGEIRKASLSKILCENLDIQSPVQRLSLDLPSEENPRFPCHTLPSINLKAWKDTGQSCQFGNRVLTIGESYLPTPCTSCICTPQGAKCATIRVTDCSKLIQEVGQDAVLKDDICSAQCSSFLTLKDGDAGNVANKLPPQGRAVNFYHAAGLRPPSPSTVPRSRNPSIRSFKLRDFAVVVG